MSAKGTAAARHTKGFNQSKFENLLLYICEQAARDELTRAKLGKCLWLSDLRAYVERGGSITGETYVREEFGPAPRHLPEVLRELWESRRLVIRRGALYDPQQPEYIPVIKPDLRAFEPWEIAIVGEVIHFACHEHTAGPTDERPHERIWQMAEIGEVVPLQAIFVAERGEIDADDVAWAKRVLAERSG